MVFKGRFFSSKKSDTSSPDASSNSPRSQSSNSPSRSDKKKAKSTVNQTLTSTGAGVFSAATFRQSPVKDGVKKKDVGKGKESESSNLTLTPPESRYSSKKLTPVTASSDAAAEGKESTSSSSSLVSPILASSLGLNRIKTRSGPLPQESFFGLRGDKGGAAAALGASNLSRPFGGKKKETVNQNRVGFVEGLGTGFVGNGSNSDSMSTGSGGVPPREQSPVVLPRSRLQNGESSSEAGIFSVNPCLKWLFNFSFLLVMNDHSGMMIDDDAILCDPGMYMISMNMITKLKWIMLSHLVS